MNPWVPRGAAITAGLAAAFAHPPFGFLIGLLGYAAIFWLADRAGPERPLRSAFFRGWLAGTAYFTVGTWWIFEAFQVNAAEQGWMAPFAVGLMAGGLGVFWGLACLAYRALKGEGVVRVLLFAGIFSAVEWGRGHVLGGFPWNLPGETWKAGTAPSQAASLVGAYGLTWVTLAAVSTAGLMARTRPALIALAMGALGIASLYAYGAIRMAQAAPAATTGPVVRVVQPNTAEQPTYDLAAFNEILRRHLALTSQPAARAPDIIVWSESGLPDAMDDYLAPGSASRAAIDAALKPGQTLLTGGYRGQLDARGQRYFNSLLALTRGPDGSTITAIYDKHRLVPFGEFMPLDSLASKLGFKQLVHVGQGFTAGPPPRPIFPPGIPPVQPLICYESLYPGFTRDGAIAAHRRAAWIANVSDDAWFGVTSGPWQHLNLASYRAIEEGLPIVRATPTGVSAIIDAYGRVVPGKLLGQGTYGVIDATLPPALAGTLFTRLGEAPFYLMLLISLAGVRFRRATLRRNIEA